MDNIVVNDEVCCYNTLSYFNDDEATTLEMINDTLDRAISKVT